MNYYVKALMFSMSLLPYSVFATSHNGFDYDINVEADYYVSVSFLDNKPADAKVGYVLTDMLNDKILESGNVDPSKPIYIGQAFEKINKKNLNTHEVFTKLTFTGLKFKSFPVSADIDLPVYFKLTENGVGWETAGNATNNWTRTKGTVIQNISFNKQLYGELKSPCYFWGDVFEKMDGITTNRTYREEDHLTLKLRYVYPQFISPTKSDNLDIYELKHDFKEDTISKKQMGYKYFKGYGRFPVVYYGMDCFTRSYPNFIFQTEFNKKVETKALKSNCENPSSAYAETCKVFLRSN